MTMIDALEPRRLFAASLLRVSSVTADNRGEILVQFSERTTGVKGSAFQVYTAGADGKLYTGDDVRQSVGFTYSKGKKLLRVVADIPKDTPYRLKLDGKTRIRNEADGSLLDGDFVSASRASGDGVAGGNYEMQVQRDTTATPTVRLRTNIGNINLTVRKDLAPISAGAFLTIANKATYDGIIVTRVYSNSLVQLGGLAITGDGSTPADLVQTSADSFGAELPLKLSNIRGTVSFARAGNTGEAGSEVFFNLTDNSDLDTASANNPTPFTPFAQVSTTEGYATLDTISQEPAGDLSSQIDGDTDNDGKGVDVQRVPVKDVTTFNTDQIYRPVRDGIIVERMAVLSNVVSKLG